MAPRSRPERGTGPTAVYDGLRRRILALELAPGDTLEEKSVVEDYGVSRTPVREALVRLAGEGLVDLLPNRGARVASFDLVQLQEHLEAFELLQRAATVLAAERRLDHHVDEIAKLGLEFEVARDANKPADMIDANWRFHQAIAGACGNRVIAKFYESTLTDGLRVARLAMSYECYGSSEDYELHLDNIVAEHGLLLEAIRERDREAAGHLADSHTALARRRVADFFGRGLTPEATRHDHGDC